MGRKQQVNFKVDTKKNPSDDPTRGVPLRKPERAPKWLKHLLDPEEGRVGFAGAFSGIRGGACKECFSGSAGLSRALARRGCWVEPPLEAYPSAKRYVPWNDLDRLEVRLRLRQEILSGLIKFLHFGLPCKGWGQANKLNGGTRRRHCPDGGEHPLERELQANAQARYVVELCWLIHHAGGWFSIENLGHSDFWRSSMFLWLSEKVPMVLVKFDMCCYRLSLPGADPHTYCRKHAGFASNLLSIRSLERHCPGVSTGHKHETAWGSRVVDGRRVSLAKSAGHYPRELCDKLAELVAAQLHADCPHSC